MMDTQKVMRVFMAFFVVPVLCISCGTAKLNSYLPDLTSYTVKIPEVKKENDSTFVYRDNFLTKNKQSLWEMYLSGNALQLGYNNGALSQKLLQNQEHIFFAKVEELVPSPRKQRLLRTVLKFYNRKMPDFIRNDFQAEIYGLSRYSSDRYDDIAPKFLRNLYLHGAHDIGHAMQDLMLVGCSSLAVWNEHSENGKLLIGRNFDFYAGDDFAAEKMVIFVKPEQGIPYMSVSWPGMTGVVSGMNKNGLTVTINAGKSRIPWSAKTPVSLVTKEILQFASTIDEAIAIARSRQVFVSESIMVGSAQDGKAVLIEVSPKNFGVHEVANSGRLICSNHFQSESYRKDRRNARHQAESHSQYRWDRMHELLAAEPKLNPESMAAVLRNREGLQSESLGYGNEKALNQLLAHHAVIFSPEERLVWVSSSPYQLGEMVAYDLNEIFSEDPVNGLLAAEGLNIARDPFASSQAFLNYENYRAEDRRIAAMIQEGKPVSDERWQAWQQLNPDLWLVYYKAGIYYYNRGAYAQAISQLETALTKVITTVPEEQRVQKYLRKARRKASGN